MFVRAYSCCCFVAKWWKETIVRDGISTVLLSPNVGRQPYKVIKSIRDRALVYLSGPWENILTLWHYLKI